MAEAYQMTNPEDRFKQFDTLRQRAQQSGNIAKQQQGEAMKRRFAALGNLNSGAYVKAAGLADQQADKNTAQSVQDVDLAQQQEKARLQDIADERSFQSGEAEKGRIFNRELFDKDMSFKQAVQADESKRAWADLDESIRANKINALQAVGDLNDETLRAASGVSKDQFTGSGIGQGGKDIAIQAFLKKYGYG